MVKEEEMRLGYGSQACLRSSSKTWFRIKLIQAFVLCISRYFHGRYLVSAGITMRFLSSHDFMLWEHTKTWPADCQRYVRGSHAGR
jgi:hypothetical protein